MLLVAEYSFSNGKAVIYIMYTSPRLVRPLPTHGRDGSVALLKSRQWAGDTSIFRVVTVVHIPGYMGALLQGGLRTGALEIVQQDCSFAGPKESFPPSHRGLSAAQLATHNLGVREVPSIIAHCAPTRIWVHLYPTLTLVLATHQSHHSCKSKEESHKFSLGEMGWFCAGKGFFSPTFRGLCSGGSGYPFCYSKVTSIQKVDCKS